MGASDGGTAVEADEDAGEVVTPSVVVDGVGLEPVWPSAGELTTEWLKMASEAEGSIAKERKRSVSGGVEPGEGKMAPGPPERELVLS